MKVPLCSSKCYPERLVSSLNRITYHFSKLSSGSGNVKG
jgi:hypothetical protein